MYNNKNLSINKLSKNLNLWAILLFLALITYLYYANYEQPSFVADFFASLGLTRHAFERILFLGPIVGAGFRFGWVGGIVTSFIALVIMLPRAIFITEFKADALFETISVFIIGNMFSLTFYSLKKERGYRQELEQTQDKMRFYLNAINKAQEEERKRISQELHDDTIQSLVVLSRGLDLLASTNTNLSQEEYRHRLEKLREQSNEIMTGIRRLSQDLRPAALDRLGLISALESLSADISKYWKININFTVDGTLQRMNADKELAIFRIVQEALRNVWRHSKATKADVNIEISNDILNITVSDNGQGFNVPKDMNNLPSSGKLGMAGMFERAQLIGATINIESEVGKGTKVSIQADIH